MWGLWRLYRKAVPKMGALVALGQYAGLFTFGLGLLNDLTQYFPTLASNHWFVAFYNIMGIVATFLPGYKGIVHKMTFGEVQNPAERSAAAPTAPATGVGQPIPEGAAK
jgi:hypothetical protein